MGALGGGTLHLLVLSFLAKRKDQRKGAAHCRGAKGDHGMHATYCRSLRCSNAVYLRHGHHRLCEIDLWGKVLEALKVRFRFEEDPTPN